MSKSVLFFLILISWSVSQAKKEIHRYSVTDLDPEYQYVTADEDLFCREFGGNKYGLILKGAGHSARPQAIQLIERINQGGEWNLNLESLVVHVWDSNIYATIGSGLYEFFPSSMHLSGEDLSDFKLIKNFQLTWQKEPFINKNGRFGEQMTRVEQARVVFYQNQVVEKEEPLIGSFFNRNVKRIESKEINFICYYELHIVDTMTGERRHIND